LIQEFDILAHLELVEHSKQDIVGMLIARVLHELTGTNYASTDEEDLEKWRRRKEGRVYGPFFSPNFLTSFQDPLVQKALFACSEVSSWHEQHQRILAAKGAVDSVWPVFGVEQTQSLFVGTDGIDW